MESDGDVRAEGTVPAPGGPDATIVYKRLGRLELKMHIFRPVDWEAADSRPAIVFFFGGGWVGGAPEQFYPHCRYLASRGMVAMAAEYRVKSSHGTTPFECVKDGKSAVRWIKRNASKLGVDPKRVLAGGGSAGGHVAAAAGMVKGLDEEGEDTSVSARPEALVLFNPVYDNGPGGYGHDRVKDRWREISPMKNIDKDTPPTIVFFGSNDKHVSAGIAEKYRALMEKVGVRSDLHVYEGPAHGFFNYRDGTNRYYYLTVIEADRFLASLGYLEGEPTLEIPAADRLSD